MNVNGPIFVGICYQGRKRKGISLTVSVQISPYVDGMESTQYPGVSVRTCNNIKIIYSHTILISLSSTTALHATCREYLRCKISRSALQTSDAQSCLLSPQHQNMHAECRCTRPGPRLDVFRLVILFISSTKYFTRILTLTRGNKQFTDISGRILSSPHSDLLAALLVPTMAWPRNAKMAGVNSASCVPSYPWVLLRRWLGSIHHAPLTILSPLLITVIVACHQHHCTSDTDNRGINHEMLCGCWWEEWTGTRNNCKTL